MIVCEAKSPFGVLRAACQPRFAPACDRLLAQVAAEDVDPATGTVPFAWWPLPAVRDAGGWRLHSPIGPDPADLTPLLGVHLLQLDACRRFGSDPSGPDPDATVAIAAGALDSQLLMLRRAPPEGEASGWHVRADGPLVVYDDAYEHHTVRELFARRTGLLVPLALGQGWFVRMDGDTILEARHLPI